MITQEWKKATHMDRKNCFHTQITREGGVFTHSRLAPANECKGIHNILKWMFEVVHMDESNRRHTRWHAPHADHSSRDNKVAIILNKEKFLFCMGNLDSLLHLCGIAVQESHLPHHSISLIINLTSTLPSMVSIGTICSTFWLNHPTNPQESASFHPSTIMRQSLSSMWLLWEIPSTGSLYQVQLLFNIALLPPS
jgi:hypothetical protein